jgi:hypothetical protein
MAKLVWRVKLVAELEPGVVSETEVARIERNDFAVPETVGLTLDEGKRLMADTQAEIVRAQVSTMGERFRWCEHCGSKLRSKGYYPATFCSVFGDVGIRIRRLRACGCRAGQPEPKHFAAMFAIGGVAPELAYVTAKFAALAPFARVADLLSELLPIGGAANAGTVRNRTMRVGATMAGLRKTSRAPWSERACGAGRPPPCCRMAMPGCGIFSAPARARQRPVDLSAQGNAAGIACGPRAL